MKILQVHKYCNRKRGGGSVTAFFETVRLLEKKGEQVKVFSMKDDRFGEEFPSENFAEHFDINQPAGVAKKVGLAARSIFNFQAQKSLEKFLTQFQPDIAHIHNIYHYLTPSIFFTLKKQKIPMVMKLSDYKLICPNYKLFNRGKICQKCRGGKYYHCFWDRCLKNSSLVSFAAMLEAYCHWILKSYDNIDLFLSPSQFMKDKCVEFGIDPQRIQVLRNTVDEKNFDFFGKTGDSVAGQDYFLYFGRLSPEKGLTNLIRVVFRLKQSGRLKQRRLLIAGDGPQRKELETLVERLGLKKEVVWAGFRQGRELQELIAASQFVILPSVWFDNSPLVISEAQLSGKAVLVSRLGGSPEMIEEGKTGWLFDPHNEDDFIQKLSFMLELSPTERSAAGRAGRQNILGLNGQEEYYSRLMAIYEKVINNYSR